MSTFAENALSLVVPACSRCIDPSRDAHNEISAKTPDAAVLITWESDGEGGFAIQTADPTPAMS